MPEVTMEKYNPKRRKRYHAHTPKPEKCNVLTACGLPVANNDIAPSELGKDGVNCQRCLTLM